MKYRIISTIILFLVLGVCYVIYESNTQSTPSGGNGITINQ
jgi:hypothetical protein